MKHKVKIVRVRRGQGFGPGFMSWAECSCGFSGPSRDYKIWAHTDGKKHLTAVVLGKEKP